MGKEFEPRKNFFADELNMDRMNSVLNYVIENLTLTEILKMTREISNDMVCYYDKETKGRIYNGDYSREDIENATYVQRHIRDACDFFHQIVIQHHSFDDKYLREALGDRSLIEALKYSNSELQKKIKSLEAEIRELK